MYKCAVASLTPASSDGSLLIFINAFITFGCNKVEDIEFQINTYLSALRESEK